MAQPPRDVFAPPTTDAPILPEAQQEEALIGQSGANALLAVAILETLGTLLYFFVLERAPVEPVTASIAFGIVAAFFGLYFWARSNAYPALITGLCLFLGIHGLNALVNPASIFQGILMKVVVLVVLVGAIRNIRQHRAVKKAYGM
ncbi:MAG: hypothetical protein R3B09_09815 [Nannocystaceae bacterium]